MSYTTKRFAIRTVINGSVTIGGKVFTPDKQWLEYDGRLDGMRLGFGRYDDCKGGFENFVSLWGTERAFHSNDPDIDQPGPAFINRKGSWFWWSTEEEHATSLQRYVTSGTESSFEKEWSEAHLADVQAARGAIARAKKGQADAN